MTRIPSIFFVFIFIVSLSGCIAESIHPLSDPENAKYDDRLMGLWRSTFDGDIVCLHFGNRDDVSMDIIVVEHKKDGGIDPEGYVMFPTIIDKTYYMNVQRKDLKQRDKGYIFVKYEITENILNLWLIDNDKIKRSIENGIIEGKIVIGKWGDTIKITDTTPNLVKYIRSTRQNEPFKFLGRFQNVR